MDLIIRKPAASVPRRIAACLMMLVVCTATAAIVTGCKKPDPDLATPKQAAVTFFKAMESGDMDAMRKSSIGTDSELEVAKKMGLMFQSYRQFEAASIKKWGDKGKLPAEERKKISMVSEIETYEVKIEGDKATLIDKANPSDKNPFSLKKDGSDWKVEIGTTDKDESEMGKKAEAVAAAVDKVAADVDAGKYSIPEDALTAMRLAIENVMK